MIEQVHFSRLYFSLWPYQRVVRRYFRRRRGVDWLDDDDEEGIETHVLNALVACVRCIHFKVISQKS